ncbi:MULTISPECIES: integrase [unclassified Novosphingobium]|uniref:integrase n=1 Tax=unclassified Novosphingobium TaxID=2644732 RepID=UPI0025F5788F|nr:MULTISPECIES: integrase [unclassified Novosphingobium]HQV05047.1 integrase [Novosphingobium sp.]
MTAVSLPAHDDGARETLPVLMSVPLRPGCNRADLSRYGDQTWDLSPGVFRDNARRCHVTVHFSSIEDPAIADALRQFLHARLNVDLPGHRPRLQPAAVRGEANRALLFFNFVKADLGRFDLARVDQSLLDRFARSKRREGLRPVAVAVLLRVIFDLHELRRHLPTARLRIDPWPGRSPFSVAGARYIPGENRTPRIPEAIMTPLLSWSLRYVTCHAGDILAARAELDRLEATRNRLIAAEEGLDPAVRRLRQRQRLLDYVASLRQHGRGIPIWTTAHNGTTRTDPQTGAVTPPINYHLIHLHAGINAQAEPAMHLGLATGAPDLIAAAIAELGTEIGGIDTPNSADPDTGLPWRTRFDAKVLPLEEVMLQSAAYIVCAFLSGMRDSEIQAMRRGCLSITRTEDGTILRYRIKSTAYKGKRGGGEETEWVTIAPVAEAIDVLERLSARAGQARGTTTLWPVLTLRANTKTHVSAEIVRQLNRFRDHLNDQFGSAQAPVIPAGPDGRPWRLTTRQFRRTIAWHIANRPFGTIAGMIQYKHASVAAFEGYAGSSRSGFRGEIEAQRALGQIDDILVYFDERQSGARLGGPAANRVGATLDTAAHELGPLPAMIADRPRLRTMLGSLARTLHVGPLADCFFDPATALCLNRISEPGASGPMISMCEPVRCPNACIAERHRPAWQRGADEARLLLREKRLPEPQRVTLQAEVARIQRVLEQIAPGTATPHNGMAGEEEEAGLRVTD